MINQKSREVFYFKTPVFLADLSIHILVLIHLLNVLPAEVLADVRGIPIGQLHLLLALAFSISISFYGLRIHEREIRPMKVLWRAFLQTATTYLLLLVFVTMVYKVVPRRLIMIEALVASPLIMSFQLLANMSVRLLRKLGRNTRHVVIIGADEVSLSLYKELQYGQVTTGYKVLGYFTAYAERPLPKGVKLLGNVESFFTWIQKCDGNYPDEIYCSLPPATCQELVNRIVKVCNDHFIDFIYVPNMDGYPRRQMTFSKFGNVNVIKYREEPMNTPMAKIYKRGFDIVFSLTFLVTIYPFVLLFVWIGNKVWGNEGPLYFKQARTGSNGKSFMIYKFRSMRASADADRVQATKDDPRKTKFGDFLRRSSIDELPQFINVLKGDMSVIGPRPHMEYHTEMYSSLISNYMVRHLAKSGITGWAQVSGCRGETRTLDEMKDRVEHDIWYIEHWSPLLDIEIFFKTIWQVLPGHDKQAYSIAVAACCMMMTSCFAPLSEPSELDMEGCHKITINVSDVGQSQLSRASATGSVTRLDLAVFDEENNSVSKLSQVRSVGDFMHPTISLPEGDFKLVIIAHSGEKASSISKVTEASFDGKVTDTFAACASLTIDEDPPASVNIELSRVVSMIRFVIPDSYLPEGFDRMKFYYTGGSSTLNPQTGFGSKNSQQTEYRTLADCTTDDQGRHLFEIYTFPHSATDVVKVTMTPQGEDGSTIGAEKEISNIPIKLNSITECQLANQTGVIITINDQWGETIDYWF